MAADNSPGRRAQARPAADRRNDMGVADIELGGLDQRLIGGDRRLVLGDQRHLVGDLLLGDRILFGELLIAGEVALRLGEQGLVLGQLALRLRQRRLIGTRIDLGDEIALLDGLPLGKADVLQRSRDLCADGHGLERRDRPERIDGERHFANNDRRDANGLWRLRGTAGGFLRLGRRGGALVLVPGIRGRSGQSRDDDDPQEPVPPPPRRGLHDRPPPGAGAEPCVTSSGLKASFIATLAWLVHAWHVRIAGSNQPRVRGTGLIWVCLTPGSRARGVAFSLPLRHKRGRRRRRHGCGCSSGVEHNLAKVGVEGSNPFARSKILHHIRPIGGTERSCAAVWRR